MAANRPLTEDDETAGKDIGPLHSDGDGDGLHPRQAQVPGRRLRRDDQEPGHGRAVHQEFCRDGPCLISAYAVQDVNENNN